MRSSLSAISAILNEPRRSSPAPTVAHDREVQSRFPVRGQLDITIEYVRFVDEHEAEVGFTLLLPGPRPVPGMQVPSKGYAVEQDGTWKVARATYSELIGRLGIRVPPPTET
jgi:hypothetical protein